MLRGKRQIFLASLLIVCIAFIILSITACGGGGGGGDAGGATVTPPVEDSNPAVFSSPQALTPAGGTLTLPDGSSLQASPGLFQSPATVTVAKYAVTRSALDSDTHAASSCLVVSIPAGTLDPSQSGRFLTLSQPGAGSAPQLTSSGSIAVNRYLISAAGAPEKLYGPAGSFRIDSDSLAIYADRDITIEMISEDRGQMYQNFPQGLYEITGRNWSFRYASTYEGLKIPIILISGLQGESDSCRALFYGQFISFINAFFADSELTAKFSLYSFRYDPTLPIEELAGDPAVQSSASLFSEIGRVFSQPQKMVLIGYSFGGLIGHYMIQKCGFEKNVVSFFALGVPFHGVPAVQWCSAGHLIPVSALCMTQGIYSQSGYDFFDEFEARSGVAQELLIGDSPQSLRNTTLFQLNENLKAAAAYHCYAGKVDRAGVSASPQRVSSDESGDGIVPLDSATLQDYSYSGYDDMAGDTQVFDGVSHSALPSDSSVIGQMKAVLRQMSAPPSGTVTLLCYASNKTGVYDIFTMQTDGSMMVNLTDDGAYDTAPDFNPTATRIAYHSLSEIFVMDTDGGNKINLTRNETADWNPDWTPDGSRIVFDSTRTGHWEIFSMNADGSDVVQLTNTSLSVENRWPSVSPDGTRIIFSSSRSSNFEIWSMTKDGADLKNLTNNAASDQCPEYSPNGAMIVFTSNRGTPNAVNIWKMNADGSAPVKLTNATSWICHEPSYFRDGTRIAYASNLHSSFDIFTMDTDGGNVLRLTTDPEDEYHPTAGGGVAAYRLTVSLTPQGAVDAGARWSADGGSSWLTSGDFILAAENAPYTVVFSNISGYETPASISGNIGAGDKTLTGAYADWKLAKDPTAFAARYCHKSVNYDSRMWIISGGIPNKNDVYSSTDGITWSPERTNGAAGVFSQRESPAALSYKDKIWLTGGWDTVSNWYDDTCYSTTGSTWTQTGAGAKFTARHGHTMTAFDDKMWVIGGYNNGTFFNDAWYSTDAVTWHQATSNAAFLPRYHHASFVYDGRMWVIGGHGDSGFFNDVWYSYDGAIWHPANATGQFSARRGHTGLVFGNKMWVLGGSESGGIWKNDAWYSIDGTSWSRFNDSSTFTARGFHTSLVFNNRMWVMAGHTGVLKNDAWYSIASADNTPVDIGLPTKEATVATAAAYSLPSTGEIQYNDGTFAVKNLSWAITAGNGSLLGNVFTAPDAAGVTEITGSFAENGVIVTKIFQINTIVVYMVQGPDLPAAFTGRAGHASAVFDGRLWIAGGWDGSYFADVWSTTDPGTAGSWSQFSALPRAVSYPGLTGYKDRLWALGGGKSGGALNDRVDNTDGIAAFADQNAGPVYDPFNHANTVAFNNRLWVIGGWTGSFSSDVWRSSTDGKTWEKV
ncbi:MAG: hypothetical protein PHQ23_14810, partial [Candidatus Wallbacteria bacterium]|nr:hypothetical protein [Candidatus Wallbacteria bacterium]